MAKTNKTNKKIVTLTSLVPLAALPVVPEVPPAVVAVVPEAPPALAAVVAAVVAAQSKSAFVRSLPLTTPAKEVVALAAAAGLDINVRYVHSIQSQARHGKGGVAKAKAKATDPKGRVLHTLQHTIEKLTKLAAYSADSISATAMTGSTLQAIVVLREALEAAHELDTAWAPVVAEKATKAPKGFQVGQLVDLTEKRRAQYEGIVENVTGLVVVKVAGKSMVVETTDGVRMFLPTAHFCAHGTAPAAEVVAIAAQ